MIVAKRAAGMSPAPAVPVRCDEQDRALLRDIASRDRVAFETLYGDYHPRLCRFLTRLTNSRELIEEVINDTFWVVWQKAADFRGQSKVSTWIMGIAYRCTLKSLRSAGSMPMECRELTDDDLPVEEPQAARDLRDWVEQGLRHLPVEQRITLQLAYYLGHSCEEIAEITDCPVSTVKARMFHARVKLRNLLPALGGLEAGSRP